MKVHVTDRHIRQGLFESYDMNAVCLAVKDVIYHDYGVRIDKVEIIQPDYIFIDGRIHDLPSNVQRFLHAFHAGREVKPIVFELSDLPPDFFS